jgi:Icc-related predicted phosphoesterase
MKIAIYSDLHLWGDSDIRRVFNNIRYDIPGDTDVVVICGDIIEAEWKCDPYKKIHKIFQNDIPVICVLGNHEFFGRTVKDTHDYYRSYYNPEKYNIHYLDIIGYYDIGFYHFFGNNKSSSRSLV